MTEKCVLLFLITRMYVITIVLYFISILLFCMRHICERLIHFSRADQEVQLGLITQENVSDVHVNHSGLQLRKAKTQFD